jgi:hypothetical protein
VETSSAKPSGRAGAWALIVLGILGLALTLGGAIAVWALNSPATDLVTSTLETVRAPLERAESGLAAVNGLLDEAQVTIDDLNSTLASVGENLQADSLVLRALGSLVSEDLKASVDKAVTALENVRSTAATIESILTSLDRLPGVEMPDWIADVTAALDELSQVSQQIQETVTALNALRTGAIEDAVASINVITGELETRLGRVEVRTAAAHLRVSSLLMSIETWQAQVPGWIDAIAVVLTLILVLMGLGQWALLSLGWSRLKTGAWIPFYPLRKGIQGA